MYARRRSPLLKILFIEFLVGMGLFLYPVINGAILDYTAKSEAVSFLQAVREDLLSELPDILGGGTEEPIKNAELWEAVNAYNQKIWNEKQAGLTDPWAYEQPSFDLGSYGIENQVFATISIPKLQLELPIYLGATSEHMAAGAAHLSQTSLPVGGQNTNCVIAGHRGWNGAKYFKEITNLQEDDEIIITNLWEELHYSVIGTQTIAPYDVEKILIQPGKDMITLLTCCYTPEGGKLRYLVYCQRA